MSRWLALLAAAALAACSAPGAPPATKAASTTPPTGEEMAQEAGRRLIGKHAPAATLTTIDGEAIELAELYGRKPVYLKFWATWCAPCREQVPHLKATHAAAGEDLAVIAIDAGFSDTLEEVKAYRQVHGLAMPIVIDDGRLAAALNLKVTPQHIVIGRHGRILHVGHLADERLERALKDARAAPTADAGQIALAQPPRALSIGEAAPPISLAATDGAQIPLADPAKGKPTVLVFMSPWCESYLASSRPETAGKCQAARETVDALARSRTDVRWVGVATGLWTSPADVEAYRQATKTPIPLVLDADGAVFRRFGVTGAPAFARLDRKGRLEALADEIDERLLAGS